MSTSAHTDLLETIIFKMFKDFNIEGQWGLPTNTNQVYGGILSYISGESIRLKLIGSYTEDDVDIIPGVSIDGKEYTLNGCMVINSPDNNNGISSRIYSIDTCITGWHYENKEDLLFDRASLQYNLFEDWVGNSLLNFNKISKPIL